MSSNIQNNKRTQEIKIELVEEINIRENIEIQNKDENKIESHIISVEDIKNVLTSY